MSTYEGFEAFIGAFVIHGTSSPWAAAPAALRLDSTATPNKNIQTEEYNMTTINLRELYPWYTEDTFIEVSDEVAAFLEEDKRLQINYAQYIRDNKAFYSLDAGDGIEAEALNLPEQPDEALERMELERLLKEAMAQLTPAQRRRVLAHFVEGRSQLEIAASEGVVKSTVSEAISRGRKNSGIFSKVSLTPRTFARFFLRYMRGILFSLASAP
ncbi:sigma-70 family RNA polymerase sigma factor [Flavonifractor plautii]|nr:sigma-70 family RNA polymerase sigma factor [Flavonifractor plautii]